MLENLRRGLTDGVRRHTDQCSIHIPHLANVSSQRNVPEVARESFRSAQRPADERSHHEIMAQRDQLRASPPDPAETDNSETQWFRKRHGLR